MLKTTKNNKTSLLLLAITGFFLLTGCEKNPANDNPPNGGGGNNGPLTERIILDTSYGAHAQQKMDIYLPAGRNSSTKLIVLVHGGAWKAGNKSDFNPFIALLRAKWPEAAIANINYRLASDAQNIHHTEIMSDISAAVQFMAANKNSFAISDTMAMTGASAGGHLAMLYTYAHNTTNKVKCVANIFGPSVINDWSWYNSFNIWLGANVGDILKTYTGSAWNEPLYQSVSPYSRVTASSKPTIIFHGTLDVIVPLYQSQWMNARLNTLGVPHEYHEYFLEGHGFNPTNTNDCANKIVAFFKTHCK
ncbi:MAG: prolyl oligopeptidase family serine peptidase [Dinghuibacter sp.]|nr:prolyl oligopeptidase family serine peptidase [Dinghuibacter sp.]